MLSPAFRQWHIRPSDDHARRALTEDLRLHLKLTLRGSRGPVLTAFAYRMAGSDEFPGHDYMDLAGSLEINTWNGTEGVQLRIKNVRPTQCGDVVPC